MNSKEYANEENWRKAIVEAQKGDRKIRDALVSENMGLVYMVAKRFQGRGVEEEELTQIGCVVRGGIAGNKKDSTDWMEWQANNVAPKILMPAETVRQTYERMCEESLKNPFVAKKLRPQAEWVIEQTAGFYQVSKQAAEIRLKELNLLG